MKSESSNLTIEASNDPKSRECRKRFHHERKNHHHHHDRHYNQNDKAEWRRLKAQKKLAFIESCLADFGTNDSALSSHALIKKQRLLKKKQRIESCQKGQCYNQRKRLGLVTPDEERLNQDLKTQIVKLNIESNQVKYRIREIKMILQDKEDKALFEEMSSLKERKKLLKNQKRALYDQLHI